ncbi:membrane transport protein [Citricoccus zhacaiensis]|uniref:Membrane transport protein n=1 Tax=Citricoccus zhacaiensis TaxID=489142 RepID=A0ABQ2MCC8_9MICC|nr:MFS transporter [Citricoccus zhacaiensis]GGO49450.1 membrane transport protein [Citricoccus zhacaiensis]
MPPSEPRTSAASNPPSASSASPASPQANHPEAASPAVNPRLLVAVLAATGIVVSLAQTLVVPILGDLPVIFGTDVATASWVITVTLLVGAVSTPVMGRLADLYGKKRMMLVAVTPFIIGSIVCALATDVVVMILGRGLQGLGTGMIPLGISLIHDVLSKEKAGSAIALMSSSMGIGGALGIPVAAAIAQFASWRVLFWATAAIAVATAVAIALIVPALRPSARPVMADGPSAAGTAGGAAGQPLPATPGGKPVGFDVVGAIGLAIGLTALLLGISKGAEWGWGSVLTLGSVGVAVVVLVAWGAYEWRRPGPLVDLRTTLRPVVLLTNLASVLFGFSMYAMNLIIPQVMQLPVDLGYGLGQTMIQMGLWMAPMGLGMMAVSGLGARISYRRGPKLTLTLAGVIIAAGYGATALILATLGSRAPGPADGATILWTLVLLCGAGALVGCGIGFAYGAMPALIMSAVPATEKASANGLNALMRSLGTTISAAVIGALLGALSQQVGGIPVPTQTGFLVALLCGAGAALVAAGVAVMIPAKRPERGQPSA